MTIEYKNHTIFAFADTLGLNYRLQIPKDADILICVGDCTKQIGRDDYVDVEFKKFLSWFSRQPAKLRLYVPSDNDMMFSVNPDVASLFVPPSITVLENDGVEFEGISFFSRIKRYRKRSEGFYDVPCGVDFLITHTPAEDTIYQGIGDRELRTIIDEVKPKYHLFGHLYGEEVNMMKVGSTTYCNVSSYDQITYQHTPMDTNSELTNLVVKSIEEDIITTYTLELGDYENDSCLLSLRKKWINEMVLSHQEDLMKDIREFNDCLKEALKEMYDRAHRIYDDVSKHKDYGDEIEVTASLYLGSLYPELHPIQDGDRQDLWDALCDDGWNIFYDDGICQLRLPTGSCKESFEAFIGMDCPPPNRIGGLDPDLTKDLHLCMQFYHLFDHTEFAITDFIYVRDFYSEIKVEIVKGRDI